MSVRDAAWPGQHAASPDELSEGVQIDATVRPNEAAREQDVANVSPTHSVSEATRPQSVRPRRARRHPVRVLDRTGRLAAVTLALTALLLGCTGAADSSSPTPSMARPTDMDDIIALYEEDLADHGVILTERGGLFASVDRYERAADGTHLALYVAPAVDQDDEAYARGLVELTAMFATDVFDRWPQLATMDVCQEVYTGRTDAQAAPSRTQVMLTRATADDIDWTTVTVTDLLVATAASDGSHVLVDRDLTAHLDLGDLDG